MPRKPASRAGPPAALETAPSLAPAPRTSASLYHALVELASDALVVTDAAGRIRLVNAQTETLFGYPRADLLGQPVELLLPERFRQVHEQQRRSYAVVPPTRPSGARLHVFGRRRDGSEFPAELKLSALPSQGAGGESLIASTIRMVKKQQPAHAARAEAEAARAEAEAARAAAEGAHLEVETARAEADRLAEELERTFEQLAEGLFLYDAQGRLVRTNAAARQLLALDQAPPDFFETPAAERLALYRRRDLIGQPLASTAVAVERALRGEVVTGPDALELRMRAFDGRELEVTASAAPLHGRDGQIVGAVSVLRDETERKRLQRAREHADLQQHAQAAYVARELEALQALTDTTLSHLTLEELLPEVLDRVEEIMAVDNVSILLMEPGGEKLTLQMDRGLAEVAVGEVRVLVGEGFAGRIAASRQPLVVPDLRTFPLSNPLLRKLVRSVLGVPLLVHERVVGVLHVGTAAPHTFTEADVALLQHAAERIALAIERAQLFEAERAARQEALAALAAVQASEERLRLFVEHVPAAVAMLDRELHFLAASRRWRQDHQFDEHFLGRRHDDLSSEIPERWKAIHRRCLAGAVESSDEDRFEREDGSIQWLKWEVRPWYSHPGEVGGIVIFGEDLTAHKRLEQEREEALRRSEEWFRNMANTAPVLLWLSGPDTLVTFLNEPWLQFTGRTLEQEVGNGWAEGVHPDDYQTCLDTYLTAFHARQRFTMTYRLRRADGAYRWVLDTGAPRFAADGTFEGYIGSCVDVTEREQLRQERELAEVREQAATEMAQRLDQFFAMASHDIRGPVTALTGNVQMARLRAEQLAAHLQAVDGQIADRAAPLLAALDRADESGERLQRLVPLLFDVARARSGTLTIKLALCDLAAVVHEQVAAQQAGVPGRTIRLDLPEQPVQVEADVDRLAEVLTNYLTNALKYSPDDQPVEVRLEVAEGLAVVAVRDHGPGLSEGERERVWELYHRAPGVEVQGSAGASAESLGMGLHIAKRLIELHPGGAVGIDSVVGEGSTFWFQLPLAARAGESAHG